MNPVIGSVTAILLLAVVVMLLTWMKRMTVNSGSKISYDWDEYSSELEDDAEEFSAAAAVAETAAGDEETDWVMGSDGYWWYHDKEANEWWYKDANGDIVKHP